MSEATWLSEIEISGDGIAVSLPNQPDNVPLAAPVPGRVTITAMCFDVGGLHAPPPMGHAGGRAGFASRCSRRGPREPNRHSYWSRRGRSSPTVVDASHAKVAVLTLTVKSRPGLSPCDLISFLSVGLASILA